jgi:hypothetical protein
MGPHVIDLTPPPAKGLTRNRAEKNETLEPLTSAHRKRAQTPVRFEPTSFFSARFLVHPFARAWYPPPCLDVRPLRPSDVDGLHAAILARLDVKLNVLLLLFFVLVFFCAGEEAGVSSCRLASPVLCRGSRCLRGCPHGRLARSRAVQYLTPPPPLPVAVWENEKTKCGIQREISYLLTRWKTAGESYVGRVRFRDRWCTRTQPVVYEWRRKRSGGEEKRRGGSSSIPTLRRAPLRIRSRSAFQKTEKRKLA